MHSLSHHRCLVSFFMICWFTTTIFWHPKTVHFTVEARRRPKASVIDNEKSEDETNSKTKKQADAYSFQCTDEECLFDDKEEDAESFRAAAKKIKQPMVWKSPKKNPQNLQEYNDMKATQEQWKKRNCRKSSDQFSQECCWSFDDNLQPRSYTCLPSFIVAGTLKSGTTAFTGILLQHPEIEMATRSKEVHYFDNRQFNYYGLPWYLDQFNGTYPGKEGRFINGETSGSYFHSQDACYCISKEVPNAKLIVLLRDPIDRAFSEWQMLQRRVAAQEQFLTFFQEHIERIYTCFLDTYKSTARLETCIGQDITSSIGWIRIKDAFVTYLYRPNIGLNQRLQMIHTCFLLDGEQIGDLNINNNKEFSTWKEAGGLQSKGGTLSFNAKDKKCFKGYESSQPWEDIVKKETEEISKCYEKIKNGQIKNFDQCFRVQTQGVTANHLHKSLYMMHLERWLKFFPLSQFLILDSHQLESNPQGVMQKVHDFLGVSPVDYQFGTESLEESVEARYNLTFTRSSRDYNGFQMKSNYKEMEEDIRKQLVEFFRPFNAMLFKLMDKNDFSWSLEYQPRRNEL